MPRYSIRKCRDCGNLHQTNEWPMACRAQFERKRSDTVAMPYIRSDGMDVTLNHADGQLYDSRSAYERAVKDAGCVIVGNDFGAPPPPPEFTPDSDRQLESDIVDTIHKLEARL